MKIETLKDSIEKETITNQPLILIYKDNGKIICNQYIEQISKIRHLEVVYPGVYTESGLFDLFNSTSDYLYVINVDEVSDNLPIKPNHIICGNRINKKLRETLDDYVVDIPKLEKWQLIDYAKGVLPGLQYEQIEWLSKVCVDDFRFIQEVDKIKLFTIDMQQYIFNILIEDSSFEDLTNFNIFSLTQAIQKKDINTIKGILFKIKYIDINPMGVYSVLYKNFKDMIMVKFAINPTYQSLGMEQKKFMAVKYAANNFTDTQLIKIFNLLNDIDYSVKVGKLSTDILIDYLITCILS